MYRAARTGAGTVCVLLALWTVGPAAAAESATYAFVDVNVISMDAPGTAPQRTVLVQGDRIAAVGPADAVTVPAGATVVDGRGRFLLPGLADMHAHIGADYRPGQTAQRADLLLYLATGVTTIRNAAGSEDLLRLAAAIDDGTLLGPRMEVASPLLEGANAVWDFSVRVLSAGAARAAVRRFAAQGFESIKIYHTLSREAYEAVADEAGQLGIPFFGHVPFDVGIEEVLADGQASIEHFRGYDIDGLPREALVKDGGRSAERFASWLHMSDARMDELVRATVEAGAWNCPTFVVNSMLIHAGRLEEFADHPMAAYMPAELLRVYRESGLEALFSMESREMLGRARPRMLTFLARLHAAGAPLMTGDRHLPLAGAGLHADRRDRDLRRGRPVPVRGAAGGDHRPGAVPRRRGRTGQGTARDAGRPGAARREPARGCRPPLAARRRHGRRPLADARHAAVDAARARRGIRRVVAGASSMARQSASIVPHPPLSEAPTCITTP